MAGRFALIVASGAYRDPKLSRLRTPTRDAEELARVLRDPEVGDFDVDLAVDEPESALRRRIAAFFSDRAPDDLLLVHFSCHGLKDDSGHLYFAATDTEVAQLDATAVSAEFLNRQMTRSRSRKVIALLDCCYSGAIARGLTFRGGDRVDLDDHLGGSGRVILTASSAMEYAFEGDELSGTGSPSVFTTAVVKGLETGEADRDQDHRISVEELYDYVCEQVREVTPDQSPNMLSHLEGELYVARSSYVAPVAEAELPMEIRAAIDSPLAGVRQGIVSELAGMLEGSDPAYAAAARAALSHLVEDDSRRVSAAAAAALGVERQPSKPRQRPPLPETKPAAESRPAPAAAPVPAPKPETASAAAPPAETPSAAAVPAPASTADASPRQAVRHGPAPVPAPLPSAAAKPSARVGWVVRWGPLGLSVLGALFVLACLTVFASTPWAPELKTAEIVAALGVVAAAGIAVLSHRGVRRRALDALEPVLAAFSIGVAAGMSGLTDHLGFYFSARGVVVGAAMLVASALWRRSRERARPGWVVIGAVVLASLALFLSPGGLWWGDTHGTDAVRWPLTVCLGLAAVVAVVGVAVGRANGSAAWSVLAAAAAGTALGAAFTVGNFLDYEDYTAQAGWTSAILGGFVLTVATIAVLWRASRRSSGS